MCVPLPVYTHTLSHDLYLSLFLSLTLILILSVETNMVSSGTMLKSTLGSKPVEDRHLHARILTEDGVRLLPQPPEHVEVPRRPGEVGHLQDVGHPPPVHGQQEHKQQKDDAPEGHRCQGDDAMVAAGEVAGAARVGVDQGEAVVGALAGVAAHKDAVQELVEGDIGHLAHGQDQQLGKQAHMVHLQDAEPHEQEEEDQQQDHDPDGQAVDDPEMALVVLQVDDEFL